MTVTIERSGQKIILPKVVFEEIYNSKRYITLNKIKKTYGTYFQVMVCKKEKGNIVERSSLARFMMGSKGGVHIDHIDRNPLNNVLENLRYSNPSLNGANRKKSVSRFKYKGVSKRGNSFYACCTRNGIRYSASNFKTELEAAKHYDVLAKMLFGKHAGLNFQEKNK